jgi:predicted nucleic acid-binding protein
MVFLDANVPMYLIGAEHPLKSRAAAVLQRLSLERVRLVTDAEVFQEVLHRYIAIHRLAAIQPAFDALEGLTEVVYPIDFETVKRARTIASAYPGLSAREAIHIASMSHHGVKRVLSFDEGFDKVPGIVRIF